jgi:hypothetical protein
MYNSLSWQHYPASNYENMQQQSALITVSCMKSWKYVQQSVLATTSWIKLWKHVATVCLGSSIVCPFMITCMSICRGTRILHWILRRQLQRGFRNKYTKIHTPVPFTTTLEYYKHSLGNKIKLYIIHEKAKISSQLPTIFCTIPPTTVLFNEHEC